MILNLGGKCGYWKTKTQLPKWQAKNLTPQFIFFLICPPSSLLREGNSSLWIQGQCLVKVKGPGARARGRCEIRWYSLEVMRLNYSLRDDAIFLLIIHFEYNTGFKYRRAVELDPFFGKNNSPESQKICLARLTCFCDTPARDVALSPRGKGAIRQTYSPHIFGFQSTVTVHWL